jgi:hypothetical protein
MRESRISATENKEFRLKKDFERLTADPESIRPNETARTLRWLNAISIIRREQQRLRLHLDERYGQRITGTRTT